LRKGSVIRIEFRRYIARQWELSRFMVRKVRDRLHALEDVMIAPPRLRKGLAA
jgi:hypothetical protein